MSHSVSLHYSVKKLNKMTKSDAERKLDQNKRKKAQRIRDKKPGARHEKTYRATEPEHKVLKNTLDEMRK